MPLSHRATIGLLLGLLIGILVPVTFNLLFVFYKRLLPRHRPTSSSYEMNDLRARRRDLEAQVNADCGREGEGEGDVERRRRTLDGRVRAGLEEEWRRGLAAEGRKVGGKNGGMGEGV
ncbi:hypothetical protein BDW02DRAFT_582053 [Decorospora gaudefroyi]|uniref:Uncharacterized protein n=1 Tax=Decorospora gaudefroyi TaxID=184978 RepID=A0A6A5K9S1_9PLEO|nr:hypothetical protein BDW02DRAFT_582053 [Decorospora gaudefroyi]